MPIPIPVSAISADSPNVPQQRDILCLAIDRWDVDATQPIPRVHKTPRPVQSGHRLIEHQCGDRLHAESFIAREFAQRFGARVQAYTPRLFTVQTKTGITCGAFGLRSAQGRLFLEQYLGGPVDQAICALTRSAIPRDSIVEVGHLCAIDAASLLGVVRVLIDKLLDDGFAWFALTACAQQRRDLEHSGLALVKLRDASAASIPPEDQAALGRYHDHAPCVVACNIAGVRHARTTPVAAGPPRADA